MNYWRILILGLLLLLTSTHAKSQTTLDERITLLNDAGLTQVYEKGLVETLDGSQTVSGYTVTMLWGYADKARVNLGMLFTFPDDVEPTGVYPSPETLLVDELGNTYHILSGPSNLQDENGFLLSYNFNTSHVEDLAPELTLNYLASFQIMQAEASPYDKLEVVGPFSFDLTLTNNGGYGVTKPIVVEDQDITFTLKSFIVSPSHMLLDYCLEIPKSLGGNQYMWQPATVLLQDGEPVETLPVGGGGGGGGGGRPSETITQCGGWQAYPLIDQIAGEWTLEVKQVEGSWDGELPLDLQEQIMDGVDFEEIEPRLLEEKFLIRIEGNWTVAFVFEDEVND